MRIEQVVIGARFTDLERVRIRSGLCARQTGSGLPHFTYCPNRLSATEKRRGSIECDEHERESVLDNEPVLRLSYIFSPHDVTASASVSAGGTALSLVWCQP